MATNKEIMEIETPEMLIRKDSDTHNNIYWKNSTEDIMKMYADKLMNKARADERERVISEILEYIESANTDLYGSDWVLSRDLIKKLNSLKP